jgi:replicative DNA helicase
MAENILTVKEAKEPKAIFENPWSVGVQELIDKVQSEAYKATPTGIKQLDKILGGGFVNQQLVGITGRPGAGKTAFCQYLIESMALSRADFSALYLCFEMSKEQLQARSISRLLHSGKHDELTALEVLQGKGKWLDGAKAYEKMYADKVAYMSVGGGLVDNNIDNVVQTIEKALDCKKQEGNPAPYIVIDYLQIVSVAGQGEFEAIGTIMSKLKGLAVKYDTVIIIVIANNRDSNKKGENDMFSGRGSGSIEYGVDALLSLNPPDVDNQGTNKQDNIVTVKVAKGRWIEPGQKAFFNFNAKYMEYEEKPNASTVLSSKEQKIATDLFNMKA